MLFTKKETKKATKKSVKETEVKAKRKYTKRAKTKENDDAKKELAENMASYNDVLETMKKYKNVRGYIIMVDNKFGGKRQEGLNGDGMIATYGTTPCLANLLVNLPKDVMARIKTHLVVGSCIERIEDILGTLGKKTK